MMHGQTKIKFAGNILVVGTIVFRLWTQKFELCVPRMPFLGKPS